MTKKYIYDREAAPIGECGSLLTIKHRFTECPQYQQQRQLHLNNKTCLLNELGTNLLLVKASASLYSGPLKS